MLKAPGGEPMEEQHYSAFFRLALGTSNSRNYDFFVSRNYFYNIDINRPEPTTGRTALQLCLAGMDIGRVRRGMAKELLKRKAIEPEDEDSQRKITLLKQEIEKEEATRGR